MFELTASGHTWLAKSPEVWEEEENYQVVKAFVKSVKVTNDVAERGINMMKTSVGSVRDKAQF